jgi:hypothetical protein
MAVAALVCGVIGICLFWLIGLGALPGLFGIIFGLIGLNRAKQLPNRVGAGQAKVGLVLGVIAIVASVVFVGWVVSRVDDGDITFNSGRIDSDPPNGVCNPDRFLEDPDC